MGLAGMSIALGPHIAQYLGGIVPPILACFNDPDSKVRYFACESMYNVAKVAKGEILVFFNELFDAMSKVRNLNSIERFLLNPSYHKLAADTELPVKNGAELLDRLIKDVVTEQASTYVSTANIPSVPSSPLPDSTSITSADDYEKDTQLDRAFSLPRFIPLLRERIYVLNPFTRTYLVSWLTVLDSVPELELVSFLPDFLDGLLKFLGDPTVDIRTATQNVLADFLREIREVAEVQRARDEVGRRREEEGDGGVISRRESGQSAVDRGEGAEEEEEDELEGDEEEVEEGYQDDGDEGEGSGEWVPGQGVHVDHAAIVQILLQHLSFPDEEIQSTCLRWIAEFLLFCEPTMVPLTPRLLPVILSSLAHHVGSIRTAANETNYNLYKVIQNLPVPASFDTFSVASPVTSIPAGTQGKPTEPASSSRDRATASSPILTSIPFPTAAPPQPARITSPTGLQNGSAAMSNLTSQLENLGSEDQQRSRSSMSEALEKSGEIDGSPFDYGATVNALTLQFLSEHEETRVAALEWLLMLHQKAPKRILAIDEPSGDSSRIPSRARVHRGSESGLSIALLLKMLSDPSEKVLRYDLQLLAQISSSSEDEYFPSFMMSLLSLFSTDRRLLETRGSLIIRQLCLSLNTERIYRTFAEILEKDEDLEFASIMVQNLNLIMITSPELADFRRRLRTLESKDGQTLFTILYRSWSHNAIATFSLCLLAQAYEQAYSLLQIFADLEITVGLLIQIDKLVQLLESPVFTSLRLQLLEPEKYPYLLKAMYGLLMLLPQSSAFATLRNRLSAVSSLGLLQTTPKTYAASTTTARGSTIRRDDIRWGELLTHFRQVQKRRSSSAANMGGEGSDTAGHSAAPSAINGNTSSTTTARTARRKITPGLNRTDSGGMRAPMGWKPTATGTSSNGSLARPPSPGLVGTVLDVLLSHRPQDLWPLHALSRSLEKAHPGGKCPSTWVRCVSAVAKQNLEERLPRNLRQDSVRQGDLLKSRTKTDQECAMAPCPWDPLHVPALRENKPLQVRLLQLLTPEGVGPLADLWQAGLRELEILSWNSDSLIFVSQHEFQGSARRGEYIHISLNKAITPLVSLTSLSFDMRSSLAAALVASFIVTPIAAGSAHGRFTKVTKRDDDWSDPSHCPGGSIGDADKCAFEVTTVWDTPLKRWTQYGSWYDNCNAADTAPIVATVTDSLAVGNTYTEDTSISVGLEGEGISIGVSQSFSESWSTTTTLTESQSITVNAQQAGNINVANDFYLSTGRLKINYGSKKGGHYIWYSGSSDVFTLTSDGSTFSANVANCGAITQPIKGSFYYNDADYDKVKAGQSTTYTYSD
ncbi:vacuole morphology and inheritance protein 14, partial [Phenoliferia sp. Uapishka_3]